MSTLDVGNQAQNTYVEAWLQGDFVTEVALAGSGTNSYIFDARPFSSDASMLLKILTATSVTVTARPSYNGIASFEAEVDEAGAAITLAATMSSATGNGIFSIPLKDLLSSHRANFYNIRFTNNNGTAGTISAVAMGRGGQ